MIYHWQNFYLLQLVEVSAAAGKNDEANHWLQIL